MQTLRGIEWESAVQVIEPRVTVSGVHIHPFNPAFPLQVRYLHLKPPAAVAMRRHDYFEVLYMESGGALYQMPDGELEVNEGDLFVVGSKRAHGIKKYLSPTLRVVAMYFHPSIILGDGPCAESAEYLLPFEIQGRSFPHGISASTGVPAEVFDLMAKIHRESTHDSLYSTLAKKNYLKMILVLLMRHYALDRGTTDQIGRKSKNLERLQPLFAYIDRHYVENISVEQAAGVLQMSKSHFTRYFREATGQAFVTHLNQFRIARAQQLMATRGLTIAAITQEVGFCDQSYFGVVFRRLVGLTPREYRERLRAT
jgi:AraC-like DNA-binding protein/quercetin dioxygenase-like cupin family protein